MESEEQSHPPFVDKLLQNCLVKLERLDVPQCETCSTVYCDEDSLTRHLATHVKREATTIHLESTSRYHQSDLGVTSASQYRNNSVSNFKTQHKSSIRDRIRFESDDDDTFPKKASDDESFVSNSDTLSANDYQFSFDNDDESLNNTLNAGQTASTTSREIAEDSLEITLDLNKKMESTSTFAPIKHILNKSYGKLIPCNICNKYFAHKSFLKIHESSHQNSDTNIADNDDRQEKIKLFPCDLCHKQFYRKHSLLRHLSLIHMVHKSRTSKLCGKKNNTKPHIQRHQHSKTDSDEKPYKCKTCKISFRSCSSYSAHRSSVHTKERLIPDEQHSEKTSLLRVLQKFDPFYVHVMQ